MVSLVKPKTKFVPQGRPPHQEERGPRYGNNRKLVARLKKLDRKRDRQDRSGSIEL